METKNVPATQPLGSELITTSSHSSMFLDMQRFADAQRVANLLSSSSLVPDHFRGKVGNCVIALNLADRMNVDPFMLMQNMYIVHGKPGVEGKLVIALIEGTGRFTPLKYKMSGSGKTDKGTPRADSCVAYATEIKSGEVIEGPPVTWEMAVAEGWTKPKGSELSKWQTMPDLMFRYRAATFFARVNCAGALMGLRTADELEDVGAITLKQTSSGSYEAPENEKEGHTDQDAAATLKTFDENIPSDIDKDILAEFLTRTAESNKTTVDEVKIEAVKDYENFLKILYAYQKAALKKKPAKKADAEDDVTATIECPNSPGDFYKKGHCKKCESFAGCPAWN